MLKCTFSPSLLLAWVQSFLIFCQQFSMAFHFLTCLETRTNWSLTKSSHSPAQKYSEHSKCTWNNIRLSTMACRPLYDVVISSYICRPPLIFSIFCSLSILQGSWKDPRAHQALTIWGSLPSTSLWQEYSFSWLSHGGSFSSFSPHVISELVPVYCVF